MRIDVVSIFPDYLAPLALSLPGKARENGLLDLFVHDLRGFTADRHRTVDDTPYGGGAGMVMKPEPWGAALDALAPDGATLVVPTPSGERFTQAIAVELSAAAHLVFACGRYEGIDQRVLDDAGTRLRVRELSLGDYVLNGGEVAAMAMIEAVIRLLPGFMGNAASLAEESHTDGLLEYPVYTKPASWRGLDVPPVLLSGDHGRIAAWRAEQSRRRTAQRRPDLLHPASVLDGLAVAAAVPGDAGELLTLALACGAEPPPETTDPAITLVARAAGRLVAAIRARPGDARWQLDRLLVAPDLAAVELAPQLLAAVETSVPAGATGIELVLEPTQTDLARRLRADGWSPRGRGDQALRLRKPVG